MKTTTTLPSQDTSDWVLTTIPFSGFYETIAATYLEDAFYEPLTADSGQAYEDLADRAASIDWSRRHLFKAYAKEYAEYLLHALSILPTDWAFDAVESPREYNFTTDRIFIKMHPVEYTRIVCAVLTNPDALGKFVQLCTEQLTSRDGFHSSYNPDYTTWGVPDTWDHNQAGILLEAYVNTTLDWGDDNDGEFDFSHDVAQGLASNGVLANMIDAAYAAHSDESGRQWLALCNEAYERRSASS